MQCARSAHAVCVLHVILPYLFSNSTVSTFLLSWWRPIKKKLNQKKGHSKQRITQLTTQCCLIYSFEVINKIVWAVKVHTRNRLFIISGFGSVNWHQWKIFTVNWHCVSRNLHFRFFCGQYKHVFCTHSLWLYAQLIIFISPSVRKTNEYEKRKKKNEEKKNGKKSNKKQMRIRPNKWK